MIAGLVRRADALEGLRVLIVEDEFFVAVALEDSLRGLGCEPVGPYMTLARALDAARGEGFDVALLDINLNGELVYPLVAELRARGTPLGLVTGYGAADLPEDYRELPRVQKPFDNRGLAAMLQLLAGGTEG